MTQDHSIDLTEMFAAKNTYLKCMEQRYPNLDPRLELLSTSEHLAMEKRTGYRLSRTSKTWEAFTLLMDKGIWWLLFGLVIGLFIHL